MPGLLVIHHSPTAATRALHDAVLTGAAYELGATVAANVMEGA